ncbi:forkhead box protein M1 isoform X2 [Hippocampus comes]|uniref:forkhead box protein M1 isoform X2 n=1 Tax=Hippocampus comes TaxID=109280 RepID=UPI00094E8BF0|nr:PREDICTED: forkhead box protein M1 isoform X2 [Hippocampus comes]
MRRSPRRPLILKRRKLPFQQSAAPVSQDSSQAQPGRSSSSERFSDTVRVLDHPIFPGTQLVVIPKTAELRSVIEALTVKGKEHGAQGPNKFILLGESGSLDSGLLNKTAQELLFPGSAVAQQVSRTAAFTEVKQPKKQDDGCPFDDSLTNMQWLERCDAFQPAPADDKSDKENRTAAAVLEGRPHTLHSVPEAACGSLPETGTAPVSRPRDGGSIKPPFSYMTMIQFAINSRQDGLMTLKEIYAWLQQHFDFFRDENRRGWKNSVRHNLSLHKMFIRKMSPDGKVSFWTIRPEANRGLTLDQVYTAGCNPVAAPVARPVPASPRQQPTLPVAKKAPTGSGSSKQMKRLLPRAPSYLVPVQLPLSAIVCPPSTPAVGLPARRAASSLCKAKRRRNAPKEHDLSKTATSIASRRSTNDGVPIACDHVKDEARRAKVPKVEPEEGRARPTAQRRSPKMAARRQQAGGSRRKQRLVRTRHEEPLLVYSQNSDGDSGIATSSTCLDAEPDLPDGWLHSSKTPIKAGRRLASSTPSKPTADSGGQSTLDFSPIRTPGAFSVDGTPFKDWALFSDAAAGSPPGLPSACSGELLAEGLVLDTLNDSLSKILVDLSFGLDDVGDLGLADVSLSELIPQLK